MTLASNLTEISVNGRRYYLSEDKKGPVLTLIKALGGASTSEHFILAAFDGLGRGAMHLKKARVEMGITQKELSESTSIPIYNISKMENGSRPIGKKIAHKLSGVLKINYERLMEK